MSQKLYELTQSDLDNKTGKAGVLTGTVLGTAIEAAAGGGGAPKYNVIEEAGVEFPASSGKMEYVVTTEDAAKGSLIFYKDSAGVFGVSLSVAALVSSLNEIILISDHDDAELHFLEQTLGNTVTPIIGDVRSIKGKGSLVLRKDAENFFWFVESTQSGGGGGGAIALQQDGVEVQATASTLNFKDGLYVDSSGNVSSARAGTLDFSIDVSGNAGLPILDGKSNTLVVSGDVTGGPANVLAAGFGSSIPTGSYFEVTFSALAKDFMYLSFCEGTPATDTVVQGDRIVAAVQVQSGTLGTIPSNSTYGMNQPVNNATYVLGIEYASDGLYAHIGGVSTKFSDFLGTIGLSAMMGSSTSETVTLTLNANPTVPAQVQAGTVALGVITDLRYPVVGEALPVNYSAYPIEGTASTNIMLSQTVASHKQKFTIEATGPDTSFRIRPESADANLAEVGEFYVYYSNTETNSRLRFYGDTVAVTITGDVDTYGEGMRKVVKIKKDNWYVVDESHVNIPAKAAYASTAEIEAGTESAERLWGPSRVKQAVHAHAQNVLLLQVTDYTDADDIKVAGSHTLSKALTNLPVSFSQYEDHILEVERSASSESSSSHWFLKQTLKLARGGRYERFYNTGGGSWSSWTRLVYSQSGQIVVNGTTAVRTGITPPYIAGVARTGTGTYVVTVAATYGALQLTAQVIGGDGDVINIDTTTGLTRTLTVNTSATRADFDFVLGWDYSID